VQTPRHAVMAATQLSVTQGIRAARRLNLGKLVPLNNDGRDALPGARAFAPQMFSGTSLEAPRSEYCGRPDEAHTCESRTKRFQVRLREWLHAAHS
jgi:hypothetical protein